MDNQIVSALIGIGGAVVGVVVGAAVTEFRDRQNRKREARALASVLLWEIDDFYKLSVRNVFRTLKDKNLADLSLDVKPLNFVRFTVFETTANKIGLFEPVLVQGILGFYGSARAYLDTFGDYRQALEQMRTGQQPGSKAVTLLAQIKGSSEALVPLCTYDQTP